MNRALDLSHKMEMIRVMHEIDRSILSTLDAAEIMDTTVHLMGKVLPVDSVRVSTVDRERGGFVYEAGFGVEAPRGVFAEFAATSAAEVVHTGRIQFVGNLQEEKELLPVEAKLLEFGLVSHIRVPLVVKGETAAILSVSSRRPGTFTQVDLATLENLAAQVGIALANARLLTDLQEIFLGMVRTLSNAIDAKSPWTHGHSERVKRFVHPVRCSASSWSRGEGCPRGKGSPNPSLRRQLFLFVIPAKAGIQEFHRLWTPAFAGVTQLSEIDKIRA